MKHRGILPKVLTTFDMVAIFVAIVLFITNAAVIQSAGPAAFGWWIIGFVVFLVPLRHRDRPAGGHVPRRGIDLPVDQQGVRPVLGLLRRLLDRKSVV